MRRLVFAVAAVCALLAGAHAAQSRAAGSRRDLNVPGVRESPEVYKLPPMSPEARREAEAKLAEARAAYEQNPKDADALIWLGRRTAYLGHFQEAIRLYSVGVRRHPRDARFLRHRGHRLITTRRYAEAVRDLERAAQLLKGRGDEVEPDGLPNARNTPTGTLGSNVWYHLGLARYLRGDFQGALEAYRECEKLSKNPDTLVATSHWLYMTLRRLRREGEARRVLGRITPGMDVIENGDYYRLLLMYKGETTPEALLADAAKGKQGVGYATVAYGVGNWHVYNGQPGKALRLFLELMQLPQRTSFGYIAAEAELGRMGVSGYPRELPDRTIH